MKALEPNQYANQILKKLGYEKTIICISLISPLEIKKLNKKFRDINKTTDVLSFPIFNKVLKKSDVPRLIGDIFINKQNAKDSLMLKVLIIHGLLHIIGYDHKTNKDLRHWDKLSSKLLKKYDKF